MELDLIDRWEAQRILGGSMSRLRYWYRPHGRLTRYSNTFGRVRLDRAEVLELKEELNDFRPLTSSKAS